MTSAHLIERHPGVVDLAVRNNPVYQSYIFGAATTLDLAFAGSNPMFTVFRGRTFKSPTLQRSRVNFVGESNRGLTRVSYDPKDYVSATIPGDSDISFVRIAPVDNAGTTLPEGPILIVPPPEFFTAGRQSLTLNGTAPNVAGQANLLPPSGTMLVDLPKFAKDITIHNDGGAPLAVSFGFGRQEFLIPNGLSETFKETGASLLSLRGDGGTAAFRATFALVNGLLA
jgi:hypothetical protein